MSRTSVPSGHKWTSQLQPTHEQSWLWVYLQNLNEHAFIVSEEMTGLSPWLVHAEILNT